MGDDDPGGHAVVLLHGWGAPGDDLVPLAEALARPRTRFFVPAAPLPGPGGGRAWWHLDRPDRPPHAMGDDASPAALTRPLADARAAVTALVARIRARHRPDHLSLAGFSQGGMLALDVALSAGADPATAVDKVAVLSGMLLQASVPGLRAAGAAGRPALFVSHGRRDPILPFVAAELLRDLAQKHAVPLTFHPFGGAHEIPPDVVAALGRFLGD
jgi:phospholipase/carboxylesterase